MDIKQDFREEKNMDVYARNVNDGNFSNVYVKWLEAKINYTRCSLQLPDVDKRKEIIDELKLIGNYFDVNKLDVCEHKHHIKFTSIIKDRIDFYVNK